MSFVVAHGVTRFPALRGRSTSRVRGHFKGKLRGWRLPTPEQRANLYVSRMPIGVLGPARGESASGSR
jgi:hypothetical protein